MPTVRTSEEARALVAARWSKPRPVPVEKRDRFLPSGSKIEELYIAKANALGMIPDDATWSMTRRIAKRLSQDDTARKARRIHTPRPATLSDDDDLQIEFYAAEAARWRARAKRDYQIAFEHEAIADKAEAKLAALLLHNGIVK